MRGKVKGLSDLGMLLKPPTPEPAPTPATPPANMGGARLCPDCSGTGYDRKKTEEARKRGHCDPKSYMSCWSCNGNGLDPAAYFKTSKGEKE
jgi:hypothetical protein